jgi:hypothetical protein
LIQSKHVLCELKKFEIKYGCEGFDERNIFSYRNVFKFKMDFELKIGKLLGFEFQWNLMKFLLEPQDLIKIVQKGFLFAPR